MPLVDGGSVDSDGPIWDRHRCCAHAVWRADDGSVQDWAAVRPYRRGMLFHSSTGMPVVDAHDDFLRARRAQVAARAARWVAGGRRRARVPRTLTDTAGVPEPSCCRSWLNVEATR